MVGGDQAEDRERQVQALNERIERYVTRHTLCRGRLFDSQVVWVETAIMDAPVAIKCWRCGQIVFLRPVQSILVEEVL